MLCYKDTTFCASPDCTNECGRKMSDYDKDLAQRADLPVAYGYFCGKPPLIEEEIDDGI